MKVICPYCEQLAVFTSSREVYNGQDYGKIYLCRPCGAYVGVYKGTKNPLGRLANAELRRWKMEAHAAFDPIWKSGEMSRKNAYKWLASKLEIAISDCHIGMFDEKQCRMVVDFCRIRAAALSAWHGKEEQGDGHP